MINLLIKNHKVQFTKGKGTLTLNLGSLKKDKTKQSSFKEWNKKWENK